jgi:hypothetical protein
MSYITTTINYKGVGFEIVYEWQSEQNGTLEQQYIPAHVVCLESMKIGDLDFLWLYDMDEEGIDEAIINNY